MEVNPTKYFLPYRLPDQWRKANLGELCGKITTGKLDANAMSEGGAFRFYTCAKEFYQIDSYAFDAEAILVSGNGSNVGYVHYYKGKFNAYQRTYVLSDFSAHIHFVRHFLAANLQKRIKKEVNAGITPYILHSTLAEMPIYLPISDQEQQAIANALSDADALIESLEQLVAKKRQIKHGAMQQLLTGQKRLPGFTGEWEMKRLGEGITLHSGHHILAQHCNTQHNGIAYLTGPADFPDGRIQHTKFTTSPGTICSPRDILVTVKGSGSGTIVLTDSHYCISRQLMAIRVTDWDSDFIYFSLLQNAGRFKAASTGLIPGLSRSDILDQTLPFPSSVHEQTAIAAVLSDMDTEIDTLEAKLAKARQVKQGMMQELLTGRIRLVGPHREGHL